MVFSLDSVITAVGLTSNRWVIIAAVILSFVVILFFAKPIGDFILKHAALKILALAFLIVIGVTIFLEGIGKEVEKELIYVPMGFALGIEILQNATISETYPKTRSECSRPPKGNSGPSYSQPGRPMQPAQDCGGFDGRRHWGT